MDEHHAFQGLTSAEAARRQREEGPNDLDRGSERPLVKIVVEVLREPMFALLIGAGSIYLAMGDVHEASLLLGFVFVIIGITVFQERRTEKVLEALRDLSSPRAVAVRDGKTVRIPGVEVVRGDLLIVAEGDRVPADGRLLSAHELAADESMLTGESLSVSKSADPLAECRLYAGTMLTRGQGVMEVEAIGERTRLGEIGKSLHEILPEISPLQYEISRLTRRLAIIGIALSALVVALFVLLRGGWLEGILAGITLAMGILPQEFPVIMIIFMALGARRIARHNVLTRRLSAIETLGETTVLCVDKTGTLTRNQMSVAALAIPGEILYSPGLGELPEPFHELLEYAVLASETDPHDPMEKAFHDLARRQLFRTEHLHDDWDLHKEYELDPPLMAMSHLWRIPDRNHHAVAAKGSPEAIADLCHCDSPERGAIMQQASVMADRGLRVLGVAKAVHTGEEWPTCQHDFDFVFVGLVGLADPLRDEVPSAVAQFRSAGIRLAMITGDHPRTARAIAQQAGIGAETVVTGEQIDALDDGSLAETVARSSVYARVSPAQKLRIVDALKRNGEIVAMTGDGVNDAPALKSAHIGIAMGKRGTDVAREAASLVLLEDNVEAIADTIRLGRRIFANLRQAMIYTIAVHIPIIALSLLPILVGWPLLLAPVHIMFLELVIDPACSIVFEAEREDEGCMNRPPRSPEEPLVSSSHIALSLLLGGVSSAAVALLYAWVLHAGIGTDEARAMAFVALISANTVLIYSSRSAKPLTHGFFSRRNRVGGWVVAGTAAALAVITLTPAIAPLFAFSSLSVLQWIGSFAAGAATLAGFEIVKAVFSGRTGH